MKDLPENHDARALRAEIVVAGILGRGVWAGLALMLAGTLLIFMRDGDYGPGGGTPGDLARLISGEAVFPRTFSELWTGLTGLRGMSLLVLGLLTLIATPVIRVAASLIVFLIERDRAYALITFVVLALLIASFLMGKTE